jgi:LPS-assembly protein
MPNCFSPQQFRLHPLAAAVLLCSLTPLLSQTVQAQEPEGTQPVDSTSAQTQPAPATQALTKAQRQTPTSSPEAQAFFAQYYVDREQMANLNIDQQRPIAATCRGTWVTPIDIDTQAGNPEQAPTVITADYG